MFWKVPWSLGSCCWPRSLPVFQCLYHKKLLPRTNVYPPLMSQTLTFTL
uniref:Uncharacterized protein n=1 Tax=Anguilla anguilla TaxID=7936 RepID=A0A0E9Q2T3_ANGAN